MAADEHEDEGPVNLLDSPTMQRALAEAYASDLDDD